MAHPGRATCGERRPLTVPKADSGKPPQGAFMSSHPRKNVSLRSVPTFINVKQTTGVARTEISGGYLSGKPYEDRDAWLKVVLRYVKRSVKADNQPLIAATGD